MPLCHVKKADNIVPVMLEKDGEGGERVNTASVEDVLNAITDSANIRTRQKPEDKYKNSILDLWAETGELGREVRSNFLTGNTDIDPVKDFVSRLSQLYIELTPKAQGVVKGWDNYAIMISEPLSVLDTDEAGSVSIWDLQLKIREAMEKLGITQSEKAV